jgi:prepilin-type N-terminal cleavage/methylation domain-containing protein
MKNLLCGQKKERGFTLIEMLIVMAIIGIFLALALPDYRGTVARAQTRSCEVNKKMIRNALESYFIDHANQYPATIEELAAENYIDTEPECPAGGVYTLKVATDKQSASFDCSKHPG